MASIWEVTCHCGQMARVEVIGETGERVLRVGCEEHWFELPAKGLKDAMAEVERMGQEAPK